jgi:two-component system sensor histidine kinase/response regulator
MSEQKPLVLIVDDDPSARFTLDALLFREGYGLAFAASGLEALAHLDELAPDAILLDVMMPDMDGLEVCRLLKAEERWRHIPVILVTALDSKEDLAHGLDAGADDFLSKPVNVLELRARVRSMLRIKKQYDALEATLHLREDLANMIVHDISNSLMPVLGFSQLLKRKITVPDYLEEVEVIWTHARRMKSFLDDMLVLAKMEAGKPILSRSPVDVSQLVLEVEKGYGVVARAGGIDLVVELPGEPRQVSLDANLFQRVLDNLVSNALKFSPAEGTVTLRVEYPGVGAGSEPQVRIEVLDEGPGVPEEHRERIFDKFEIVALKKRNVSQVGLGLAFCKMVVEAHGGRIFVDANEPQGAVFTVEI